MDDAVEHATTIARDLTTATVQLSQEEASNDMFVDYQARGRAFKAAVAAIAGSGEEGR